MAGRRLSLALVALLVLGASPTRDSEEYVIEPPDMLSILAYSLPGTTELVDGEHLVRPDGTVSLGKLGSVKVAGMTLDKARLAIAKHIVGHGEVKEKLRVRVEVLQSNSRTCYIIANIKIGEAWGVITDNADGLFAGANIKLGENVRSIPHDGRITVASAVLEVEGLAGIAAREGIWLARPSENDQPTIMDVDWKAITGTGNLATNFRLEPGDRVYVGISPK